ncbi:MAG: pre-toxin TG domain-containing protein [Thermoactinomyces sp.]
MAVFLAFTVGQSYADPSGSFEIPEVNDDFTKVNPNQSQQPKKEEDKNTWLGDFLIWIGLAKDKKELEKLSEQANNEFLDGFIKKSIEGLLGYDLYTGDPLKGERKKDADRTLSGVVDFIPGISNIKNCIDFTSGRDSISGDKLSPVDKVVSLIGIASGPGKKIGGILKGVFNGGKKFLKRFGIYIDDLAERLGLGPRLQPAGGPPDIPRKPQVNRIEGINGGGGELKHVYNSIKDAPKYPKGFKGVKNGTKKVNVKNKNVLDKLRKVESGKWYKLNEPQKSRHLSRI